MDRTCVAIGELLEERQVKHVVVVAGKARRTIHAPLDDVKRVPGDSQSGVSWHGTTSSFMHVLTSWVALRGHAAGRSASRETVVCPGFSPVFAANLRGRAGASKG